MQVAKEGQNDGGIVFGDAREPGTATRCVAPCGFKPLVLVGFWAIIGACDASQGQLSLLSLNIPQNVRLRRLITKAIILIIAKYT